MQQRTSIVVDYPIELAHGFAATSPQRRAWPERAVAPPKSSWCSRPCSCVHRFFGASAHGRVPDRPAFAIVTTCSHSNPSFTARRCLVLDCSMPASDSKRATIPARTGAPPPPQARSPNSYRDSTLGLFALLLALRIVNALTLRTFFQPDEFFQSLEPAWQLAFGRTGNAWITWVNPHLV